MDEESQPEPTTEMNQEPSANTESNHMSESSNWEPNAPAAATTETIPKSEINNSGMELTTEQTVPLDTMFNNQDEETKENDMLNIRPIADQNNDNTEQEMADKTTANPEESIDESLLVKSNENDKMTVLMETTTTRISISEPNIRNEPSYEANPEIITLIRGNQDHVTANNLNEETTTENDWLQNDNADSPFDSDNPTEQRSSKSFDEIMSESTTQINKQNDMDEITFDLIHNKNQEKEATTIRLDKNDEPTTITSMINDAQNQNVDSQPAYTNDDEVDMNKTVISINQNSSYEPQQAQTTTMKSNTDINYSINSDYKMTNYDQNLMDALEKTNITTTEKTLERNTTNENMDVTFDTISSLYNRTSKSMEESINNDIKPTTSNEVISEVTEKSTESDWLSEPVTEVNYEDVMKKSDNRETTEASMTKVDEVITKELNKDDFEPDYLNNMESNNSKMSDRDEPLYGILHDYDNEDPRVKRVNLERKFDSTQNITEIATENGLPKTNPVPLETTTIGEYIYRTAGKSVSDVSSSAAPMYLSSNDMGSPIMSANTERVMNETMNETNRGIIIKEIPNNEPITYTNSPNNENLAITTSPTSNQNVENSSQVNNLSVTIYEVSSQNNNQTTTSPKAIHSHSTEYEDHETEMNPFLPEVENNKILVKKLQEGHDLEPSTLNETQNENGDEHGSIHVDAKTDKAQEMITNAPTISETTQTSMLASEQTSERDVPVTTEDDMLFNDLLLNPSNHDDESTTAKAQETTPVTVIETTTRNDSYEVLPISTFLLDTDDIDFTKTVKPALSENGLNNVSPTEYLSVVPIDDKESIKKNYKSDSEELNSISDSPKKSDRRTLDVSNADPVINNEA
ncbi:unnamed protein product [Colias eurytheme]|nr:unnamed protein product [Colias eurytheme]